MWKLWIAWWRQTRDDGNKQVRPKKILYKLIETSMDQNSFVIYFINTIGKSTCYMFSDFLNYHVIYLNKLRIILARQQTTKLKIKSFYIVTKSQRTKVNIKHVIE